MNLQCILDHYKPIDVEIATFMVSKDVDYAKDGKNVYYPIDVWCVDFDDQSDCYGGSYIKRCIMYGADPQSFKYLGDGYAIDKHHMYKNGERIPWDDSVIEKVRLAQTAQTECQ